MMTLGFIRPNWERCFKKHMRIRMIEEKKGVKRNALLSSHSGA